MYFKQLSIATWFRNERNSSNNIQKAKIMISGPIIPWQIEGEKVEAKTDFIFLG